MKIYTRAGDDGRTALFAGPRVAKDDPRIEAYGTVDELNAALGLARSAELPPTMDALLATVQHELFAVGAELATPEPERHGTRWIGERHIAALERAIDDWDAQLPPLRSFVLPSGTTAAASLHVARAICRRSERRVISFASQTVPSSSGNTVSRDVAVYLNRLGDLLFVLARAANFTSGHAETPWQKPT